MARAQPALPLAAPTPAGPGKPSGIASPAPRPAPAPRELWCAIVLPALRLEVRPARPGTAVAVFAPGRREILAVNAAAAAAGVRPGQSTTTAWAMCPRLVAFRRDPAAEEQARVRLAGWAAQFSPRLARAEEGLVLEIGASRRLFGGLPALSSRLAAGLAGLGYRYGLGIAPTPLAALWRARAGVGAPVTERGRIAGALAPLPLAAMALDAGTRAALEGLGVRRVGELLRLPRAGLARRYGAELVGMLERALGRLPDPRPAWRPAPVFAGTLELPLESESLVPIGFALRRLVGELAGFARGRDAAVRRLEITLETGRRVLATELEFRVPLCDAGRILALATTRLEAVALPGPVRKIGLRAADFAASAPLRALPFATDARREGLETALARIAARLGEETVGRLAPAPDHRPERASRRLRPGERVDARGTARPGWPLLLLAAPRRLPEIAGRPSVGGRLEAIGGPERIESGWWDGGGIARDYYRMRTRAGAQLWVFRDRARGGWYLHGYFA